MNDSLINEVEEKLLKAIKSAVGAMDADKAEKWAHAYVLFAQAHSMIRREKSGGSR